MLVVMMIFCARFLIDVEFTCFQDFQPFSDQQALFMSNIVFLFLITGPTFLRIIFDGPLSIAQQASNAYSRQFSLYEILQSSKSLG